MNSDWHNEHPLARNASMPERVRWHVQHAQKCACRPIPPDVQDAMAKRGSEGSADEQD